MHAIVACSLIPIHLASLPPHTARHTTGCMSHTLTPPQPNLPSFPLTYPNSLLTSTVTGSLEHSVGPKFLFYCLIANYQS
uniref:Secreted protein n=1 Tax=Mesocestoides corti TaxID=53468 RepID=A0A5K3FEJ3_MESCO